jgi:hypothetical protein
LAKAMAIQSGCVDDHCNWLISAPALYAKMGSAAGNQSGSVDYIIRVVTIIIIVIIVIIIPIIIIITITIIMIKIITRGANCHLQVTGHHRC